MNELSQTLVNIARAGAQPAVARSHKLQRMAHAFTDFEMLRASGEFQFRFEELGIEIDGTDFLAGAFNGMAHITYWNDKEEGLSWFVGDILLDCSKWNGGGTGSGGWDVLTIKLERDHKLCIDLWGALTDGAFKDSIEARVREQL